MTLPGRVPLDPFYSEFAISLTAAQATSGVAKIHHQMAFGSTR